VPRLPAAARAAVACALSLLCLLAPAARADDAKITGVRVGYEGLLPPERWSPMWVTIQAGDKPQSLVLTASYEQDATQAAVMTTPVTTTPGRTITVPLLVCPPQGVERIAIELAGGSRSSTAVFARAPRKDEINLSQPIESGALVVGTLGQRVPAEAIAKWNVRPTNYANSGLDMAVLVALRSAEMGETWACFDGLNALVVRQSVLDNLPTNSLDALARWVTGGGRLVLVADSPGDTWRRFAPPGVHLADLRPVSPPARFGRLLARGEVPAASVNARTITIDGEAEARGWTAQQRLDGGYDTPSATSLLASGPFGGGITVIAAFDPALASASLSDAAVVPLWLNLLQAALPDRPTTPETGEYNPYSYMISSGDGAAGSTALSAAVDALCDVPAVPDWVYTVIILLSTVLALAVSLGDFLILGRFKSRHRSWITAASWITLFGLVAWTLPNIVRRESTTLGRAVVIDALPTAGHNPSAAWRSGVTAIFSATTAPAPLYTTDPPKQAGGAKGPASVDGYWRGVSVLGVYSWRPQRQQQRNAGDLPLLQRVSAMDGASAAAIPTPRGIQLKQWTLRTLQDFGPAANVPKVAYGPGGPRGAFTITGLPEGARVRSAAVHTVGGWSALSVEAAERNPKGELKVTIVGQAAATLNGWAGAPTTDQSNPNIPSFYYNQQLPPADGRRFLLLDGARRRTAAFDALAQSGGYAVVHLLVDGRADITTPLPHQSRGVTLYRVAVPLTDPPPAPILP
jgi:hypothetical protein